MSAAEAIEYLVVKQLSGYGRMVDAIYDVIVGSLGPREAARRRGIDSFHSVRGHVWRFVCKAGSRTRARIILERVYSAVRSLEPVLVEERSWLRCRLCGARVARNEYAAYMHLRSRHTDFVREAVSRVIRAALGGDHDDPLRPGST